MPALSKSCNARTLQGLLKQVGWVDTVEPERRASAQGERNARLETRSNLTLRSPLLREVSVLSALPAKPARYFFVLGFRIAANVFFITRRRNRLTLLRNGVRQTRSLTGIHTKSSRRLRSVPRSDPRNYRTHSVTFGVHKRPEPTILYYSTDGVHANGTGKAAFAAQD